MGDVVEFVRPEADQSNRETLLHDVMRREIGSCKEQGVETA